MRQKFILIPSIFRTAVAALVCICQPAGAQNILNIRVIEGEGGVRAAGARDPHPLTILVTDETGKPVEQATVVFNLPFDGPGGTFASGGTTANASTGSDGLARSPAARWNRVAGQFQIRITAAKGEARAGTVSAQYVSGAATAKQRSSRGKWLAAGVIAAAAAVGGLAWGLSGGSSSGSGAPPTSIGAPTIIIGRP